MVWQQLYAPIAHNVGWSALIAVIPILYFFIALLVFRMKGHVAAVTTIILVILDAMIGFHFPVEQALSSAIYGVFVGLWPIGWIVIGSVFLFKITVKTGHFDVIRHSISSISQDRRIQTLLIALCLGAFLEGTAGFGAPVAIAGSMLLGLGFSPLYAAGLVLLADTAPVAFGGIGIPITAVASVTHLSPLLLSLSVGRQLFLVSLILPFWLVTVMSGFKGLKGVWPACLTVGLVSSLSQLLVAAYLGPQLPNIVSSLLSMLSLIILLRFWQPKETFRFKNESAPQSLVNKHSFSRKEVFIAWGPYLSLTFFIVLWTIPAVKELLAHATFVFAWPGLNDLVAKVAPIATHTTTLEAKFTWDLLGATGSALFIAGIAAKFICNLSWRGFGSTFKETLYELRFPLVTIACVVAFGQLMNYSGMSGTLALALAKTGVLFPLFAPILGWIGVFLTGSDTSSNLLFGSLQQLTAQQLHLNPYLTVGANSAGGVMGKMISPQSIAVGTSSTGMVGKEGEVYRFTLRHSIAFLLIVSVIVLTFAYVVPGLIPA